MMDMCLRKPWVRGSRFVAWDVGRRTEPERILAAFAVYRIPLSFMSFGMVPPRNNYISGRPQRGVVCSLDPKVSETTLEG